MCTQELAPPKDSNILMWGMTREHEKNETASSKACAGCQGQAGAPASPEAVIQTHMLAFLKDWLYFIEHCSRHDTLSVCFRAILFFQPLKQSWKTCCSRADWRAELWWRRRLHTWRGRGTALSCHLLFFFPSHEHLWPFKAERFGFLVIISPNACSTRHVLSVGFLLDKWYIFDIKTGNSIHLSQSNTFLNTGCTGMSSSLAVYLP